MMDASFPTAVAARFCAWLLCLLPSAGSVAAQEAGAVPLKAIQAESTAELRERILSERARLDLRVLDVLGERADEESMKALFHAERVLASPSSRARIYAALEHFSDSSELREQVLAHVIAQRLRFRSSEPMRARVRCMLAFGEDAHEALQDVLSQDPDPGCRSLALGGLLANLVEQADAAALELLITYFREPFSGTRAQGISALASFQDPISVRTLRKYLHGEGPIAAKLLVLDALAELPLPDVAKWLLDTLRSKQPELRLGAVNALARRGHIGHLGALKRLARDRDPRLRQVSWIEQWRIATDRAAFEELALGKAGSRDWATRMGITGVLGQMRSDAAQAQLLKFLVDPHFAVRLEATRSLALLRRKATIPILIAVLDQGRERLQRAAHQALLALTGLDHGPKPARWQAWWQAEGDAFEVPTLDKVQAAQMARLERLRKNPTKAAFYGIQLRSDHICFVLDVSGSMDQPAYSGDTRLTVVKRELRRTLENLPEGYLFNLIFFEGKLRSWKNRLTAMTPRVRKAALSFVERQNADGATALFDAVALALADEDVDTIVILSDGDATEGKFVDPEEILSELSRLGSLRAVRIHAITFQSGQSLLKDLATSTGGEYLEVR